MKLCLAALCLLTFVSPIASAEAKAEGAAEVVRGHVFAWPFLETGIMQPRGGTTKGAEVELDPQPSPQWQALQKDSLADLEKDRRAILAMAGSYRVSFDFIETMGLTADYQPAKPYFSWGTEHVQVLKAEDRFISLQHTLVMYFKDKDGKEHGPMVMKHWRQDWTYEDRNLHVYRGRSTWSQQMLTEKTARGQWTQAVYQVDDSPRYEVQGKWTHQGGMSSWHSASCWRPLPRREFSVRDDYQVLQGSHEITITPTGWVHLQHNQKVVLEKDKAPKVIAQELGVNRYERISSPSLTPAESSWAKTGAYWQEVRNAWADVYAKHPKFSLKAKVDGKKLYQVHFEYAAQLEKADDPIDHAKAKAHARETIGKFLILDGSDRETKY